MRALVHASTLFAPLVMLASLSSFAFSATASPVADVRAAFVVLPLATLVSAFLGQRRAGFLVTAHGLALLTLALAVYGAAATPGEDAAFLARPSLLIALLASAWATATLAAAGAEAAARAPEA